MSDEEQKKQPEIEEVVTDFGDVRVRSGFQIEEQGPGVVGINILAPVFEFPDDSDDSDDDEGDGHQEPQP